MQTSGRTSLGMRKKHRTMGHPGHNADKQILARDVNRLAERVRHPMEWMDIRALFRRQR